MKKILIALALAFGWSYAQAHTDLFEAADDHDPYFYMPFFHHNDTLAARDSWGLLHQSRTTVYETDFSPRMCRQAYYGMGERELARHPAYIGALQRDLIRLGYYCGPIDGVLSDDVRAGIATLQKNYSMHVTGTITVPVRRILHLP
jgi:hypothetical protein